MLLLLLSFILVFISSYFLMSCAVGFPEEKSDFEPFGMLYFILIVFAQVVLTFEVLSLLKSINAGSVLLCNFLFFLAALGLFIKCGKRLYVPNFKEEFCVIKKELVKDKLLLIMALCMGIFCLISLYIAIFAPVSLYDSLAYHVSRCLFWISNSSLNHFDTSDIRMLVMPINSELLYTWFLIFLKKDFALGIFSFVAYLTGVFVLYNFIRELKFSVNTAIWTVIIFSSLASVTVEASSTEIDLILGVLILTAVFLFLKAAKYKDNICLYFSALSYSLAIGVKTPAIIMIPGFLFFLLTCVSFYNRKNAKDILLKYLFFVVVNFLIFSSYNYILNFIHFGNPMGASTTIAYHSFFGGFKAFVANLIRYFFLLFDFSGFNYSESIGKYIVFLQNYILKTLHISNDWGVILRGSGDVNQKIAEPIMSLGVLGILAFIPACIISVLKGLLYARKSENLLLFSLLGMLLINIICLSFSVGFMVYSVRFLLSFVIASSPILAYTYINSNKNPLKWLIAFYSLSYLLLISTHIPSRPFFSLIKIIKKPLEIQFIREDVRCSNPDFYPSKSQDCHVRDVIKENKNVKNIAVIVQTDFKTYLIKALENEGYKVDFLLLEDYQKYDISKYDIIIANKRFQDSDYVKYFEERKNDYEFKNGEILIKTTRFPFCSYLDRDYQVINSGNGVNAFVLCNMPSYDFYKKGFRKIAVFELLEDNSPLKRKTVVMYKKELNKK